MLPSSTRKFYLDAMDIAPRDGADPAFHVPSQEDAVEADRNDLPGDLAVEQLDSRDLSGSRDELLSDSGGGKRE